jgi:hypothetical protein
VYSILRFDPRERDSITNEMLLVLREIDEEDNPLDELALRHKLERSGRFSLAQLAQLGKTLMNLESARLIFRDQDGKLVRHRFQRVPPTPGTPRSGTPGLKRP